MAMRSAAIRSESAGVFGDGALPSAAALCAERRRSMSSAAEAAPTTNTPRKGALRGISLEMGASAAVAAPPSLSELLVEAAPFLSNDELHKKNGYLVNL